MVSRTKLNKSSDREGSCMLIELRPFCFWPWTAAAACFWPWTAAAAAVRPLLPLAARCFQFGAQLMPQQPKLYDWSRVSDMHFRHLETSARGVRTAPGKFTVRLSLSHPMKFSV